MGNRKLNFIKMHSLGNDFVVFNEFLDSNIDIDFANFPKELISSIANRKTGVGCDQVILMLQSQIANCKMIVFNADGSIAEACGNASGCVAMLIFQKYKSNLLSEGNSENEAISVTIEVHNALIRVVCFVNGECYVNLGSPFFRYKSVDDVSFPISENGNVELVFEKYRSLGIGFVVNVGNPHIVFFVDNFCFNPQEIGCYISTNKIFNAGINVHFVKISSDDKVNVVTYERGVGITNACGTGAASICAIIRIIKRVGNIYSSLKIGFTGGEICTRVIYDNKFCKSNIIITLFPKIVFYASYAIL